jgi:hypothetical protein
VVLLEANLKKPEFGINKEKKVPNEANLLPNLLGLEEAKIIVPDEIIVPDFCYFET